MAVTCAILFMAGSLYWARTVSGWLRGGISTQQSFLNQVYLNMYWSSSFKMLNKIRKLLSICAVFVWGFQTQLSFESLNQDKINQNRCIHTFALGYLISRSRRGIFFRFKSLVLGSHQTDHPTEPGTEGASNRPAQSTDKGGACSSLITRNLCDLFYWSNPWLSE